MKNILTIKNIRLLLFTSFIFIFSYNLIQAQDTSKDTLSKKELRKKRKEEKEAKLQKQCDVNYKILQTKSFVLEADYAEDYKGEGFKVNYLVNFLLVDSINSVIQTGSLRGRIGANGVGGSTAKGEITSYELSKNDKHHTCYLTMGVSTSYGHFSIEINISPDGYATALFHIMNFGKFTYNGHIIPLKESKVYVGHAL